MISALNAAASGMKAQQSEIEHISNNLANINTPGFKRTRAEFQDLLYETMQEPGAKTSAQTQSPVGIQRGLGVRVAGTQRNFALGSPQETKRNLDFMIKGDGFFTVEHPSGDLAFKREGTFFRSQTGRLETLEGYALQPEIFIPQDTTQIEVSEDGSVFAYLASNQRLQVGQIQLAKFANNGGLKAIGQNMYMESEGSGPPTLVLPTQERTGGLLQGYLEGSNVSPVEEMTAMISAQRAFEMNSKVIKTVDSILQHTVNVR